MNVCCSGRDASLQLVALFICKKTAAVISYMSAAQNNPQTKMLLSFQTCKQAQLIYIQLNLSACIIL